MANELKPARSIDNASLHELVTKLITKVLNYTRPKAIEML